MPDNNPKPSPTPVPNSTSTLPDNIPPQINILSPLNQTYNESSVSLIFTLDKTVNWIGYSLDNQQNVTITGNDTIANIANGNHKITVYANDTFGDMGTSETITFTVAAKAESPEPFPTNAVAVASGASVAVVGVGLFWYFRKHNN
jgi:predicted phage tail protein